jgi:hypothetical protein
MPGDRFSLGAELKRRRGQAGLRLMLWLGFGGLLALLSFISLKRALGCEPSAVEEREDTR